MALNKISGPYYPIKVSKSSMSAGDPAAKGKIIGVCQNDTDDNGDVVLDAAGIYNLSVTANDGSSDTAVSVGDYIYIDGSDDLSVDSSGVKYGKALEALASGATDEIQVMLVQA